MQKTAFLLLILIILTLSFSLVRRNHFFIEAFAHKQRNARAERYEQAKRNFPTVDYNEPTLADTEENRVKKEKKQRFNELGNWVFANTEPYIAEHRSSANYFNFTALPVAKSDVIIIGVVSETEAHLSENKRNVFSESKVVLEAVLKTSNQALKPNSVMTVDRMGAFVKYPNGQTVLYQRAGMYMPKIGGRYLFFLNSLNKHDYGILTAYELTEAGVLPLDTASQFFVWEGKSETEIMQELRGLLLNFGLILFKLSVHEKLIFCYAGGSLVGPPENRTKWTLPTLRIPDAQCSLSTTSTIPVCSYAPGLSGAAFV